LVTSKSTAGVDADHLVEDGDVGIHRGGDLAAVATAIHHPPDVKTVEGLADAVLGCEVKW
jgi:hypothetical protein